MAYSPRVTCPCCGKRGLGDIYPHASGSYRQCQYCNWRVAASAPSVAPTPPAPSLVGKTFQNGQQRATVLKAGRTLLTVRLNDGAVGQIPSAVFSGPMWSEVTA